MTAMGAFSENSSNLGRLYTWADKYILCMYHKERIKLSITRTVRILCSTQADRKKPKETMNDVPRRRFKSGVRSS